MCTDNLMALGSRMLMGNLESVGEQVPWAIKKLPPPSKAERISSPTTELEINHARDSFVWWDSHIGQSKEWIGLFRNRRMTSWRVLEWNWAKWTISKEATIRHITHMQKWTESGILDLRICVCDHREAILSLAWAMFKTRPGYQMVWGLKCRLWKAN